MQTAVKRRRKNSYGTVGWTINLMYVPLLMLIGFFIVYPFIQGIRISFTDWNGYSQTYRYIGIQNYRRLFQERDMLNTIRNTFIYGFGSAILQNICGLSFAIMLEKRLRGSSICRTVIYLPTMISGLIMGYIWYFMLRYNGGAVSVLVKALGLKPVNLLQMGTKTVWIITFVNVFQSSGTSMMFYQAGLQNIPTQYYEASEIDGATSQQQFWRITLPLLVPSITFNFVLNLIGSLKLFDMIKSLTNGGPAGTTESLSTMMYRLYFAKEQAGYAAALGNVMFLMIVFFSVIALVYLRNKEVEL